MQLQIQPCTAQVARRPRMQTWPAKLRGTSATIPAAELICVYPSQHDVSKKVNLFFIA